MWYVLYMRIKHPQLGNIPSQKAWTVSNIIHCVEHYTETLCCGCIWNLSHNSNILYTNDIIICERLSLYMYITEELSIISTLAQISCHLGILGDHIPHVVHWHIICICNNSFSTYFHRIPHRQVVYFSVCSKGCSNPTSLEQWLNCTSGSVLTPSYFPWQKVKLSWLHMNSSEGSFNTLSLYITSSRQYNTQLQSRTNKQSRNHTCPLIRMSLLLRYLIKCTFYFQVTNYLLSRMLK